MSVSHVTPYDFGLVKGAKPVRRIDARTDRPSMPGWFPTSKGTLPSLRTESVLEIDGLEHFEANPDFVMMAAQPHHLIWNHYPPGGGSVRRLYTPDLALLASDGSITVVDFKPAVFAAGSDWLELEDIFQRLYRVEHGVTFATVTDEDIRLEPRAANVRILMLHRPGVPDADAETMVSVFLARSEMPVTVREISEGCGVVNPRSDVDRAFGALVAMILKGQVEIDMSVPIGPDSLVGPRGSFAVTA